MEKKIYVWFTMAISLLVLPSIATAQQEQWLQYHSEREAQQIIGDMRPAYPKLSSDKPEGVELPEFKTEQQFFTKWPTPMVKSGHLWIACDRKGDNGPHNLLYIDSNGDGHLNDETVVEAYRTDQYSAYFGPVKVVFEGEDGPLTYHLNFRFYSYNEQSRRLYIYPGSWYEGTIILAGARKHCVLIDYNVNGTFNDKSLNSGACDRIRIGKKDTRDTRFVGNYIEVDDVLYQTEIARDGAYITLAKAEDVTFGNVRLPETIAEFAAGGENGLFTRKPEKGLCQLPVGKYRVDSWNIERKDEKGAQWKLEGRYFSDRGNFEVTKTAETKLQVGEPVRASLQVSKSDQYYDCSKSIQGVLGEYVQITRDGRRATEMAKLHVKDKKGTFDRTFPMPDQ